MSTDYSQTGPISNWAKPSAPLAPAVQVRSDFPPAPGLVSTGPDGKELPPDQWYDALDLPLHIHGRAARARGLATDVDDVGAGGELL